MRPLPHSFHVGVQERLRVRAEAEGLDGLLLLNAANVAYATGWHFPVNERPVGLWVPVDGTALLLVPHLELENAAGIPGTRVRTYEEYPGERPPVLWMIQECRARRMAVDTLSAELLDPVRALLDRLDLSDHVKPERSVKHEAELELIREAACYADLVLERLLAVGGDVIRQGGTEAELLADCTGHAREALWATHGEAFRATKTGITASIHSGPRAALPHGAVTNRRPEPGEPIVAGIGCHMGGYHAESGVTLVLGDPTPEQLRIMGVMAEASAATVDALARGRSCAEVNEAALSAIRKAGLGDAIRHRIGHGMGVQGHEAPWLAPGDATPVSPGMVFSCEPGIYRPGVDGWRTIDTLVVGPEGVDVASAFLRTHPFETRAIPC